MGRTCFAVAQGRGGRDPSSTLSRSAHFAKLRCFLTGSALAGSKSPRLCNPGSANSSICRHHSHYMGRRARLRRELERVIRVGAAGLDAIRWHGRLRIGNRPKEMAVMQTPGRAAHVTVFRAHTFFCGVCAALWQGSVLSFRSHTSKTQRDALSLSLLKTRGRGRKISLK